MKSLRNAVMWLYMLNKRLYKRPSFIVMLSLIVGITAALSFYASNDTNIMKIAIFAQDEDTAEYLKSFTDDDSIIGYTYFNSEYDAISAFSDNGMDAAWIFNNNIMDASEEFIESGEPMVRVIQREDTVFLKIAREKLFAEIYPCLSRALFTNFMNQNFGETDNGILNSFYDSRITNDEIVQIIFNDSSSDVNKLNHLVSPVRGLLSIAIFLCAYAALIGFKKDKISGLFARMPNRHHIYAEAASILVSALNAAIVMLLSLKIIGLFTVWHIEIGYILLYVLLCTAFCILFGELVNNINILSALMPVITMLMIALCPIFMNTQNLNFIQMLLPPYYYLSAFRSIKFVALSFISLFVFCTLYAAIRYFKKSNN